MEPSPENQTNDEFGYQRFALTELAYDLVNSLTGIYAQLRFAERQKAVPDQDLIGQWQRRIHELQALYKQGDWSDIPVLEQLITELTNEYRQHNSTEQNRPINAANQRPTTVHTH